MLRYSLILLTTTMLKSEEITLIKEMLMFNLITFKLCRLTFRTMMLLQVSLLKLDQTCQELKDSLLLVLEYKKIEETQSLLSSFRMKLLHNTWTLLNKLKELNWHLNILPILKTLKSSLSSKLTLEKPCNLNSSSNKDTTQFLLKHLSMTKLIKS